MEWSIFVFVAICIGLVEVIKRTELICSKFLPLTALAIGIGLALLGGSFVGVENVTEQALMGLIIGLSSVGLYSGGKNVGEGIQ